MSQHAIYVEVKLRTTSGLIQNVESAIKKSIRIVESQLEHIRKAQDFIYQSENQIEDTDYLIGEVVENQVNRLREHGINELTTFQSDVHKLDDGIRDLLQNRHQLAQDGVEDVVNYLQDIITSSNTSYHQVVNVVRQLSDEIEIYNSKVKDATTRFNTEYPYFKADELEGALHQLTTIQVTIDVSLNTAKELLLLKIEEIEGE